jgi:hypothetical protein
MQLGTRWPVGGPTPDRIPDEMAVAIAEVEAHLGDIDTSQWRWTLTWLEGRPVAELDDGTIVRVDHAGAVTVTAPPEG